MMLGVSFTPVGKMLMDFPWEVVPIVLVLVVISVGILCGSLRLMGIKHISDIIVPDKEDGEND